MGVYSTGIVSALLVFLLSGQAVAAIIVLKSGGRLATHKAWVENGEVKFYINDVEVSYKQEEVLEIINEDGASKPQPQPNPTVAKEPTPAKEKPKEQPKQSVVQSTDPEIIVAAINLAYGSVCKAKLTGWMTKTLKVDWTAKTSKLTAMMILADIGKHKEELYVGGVRYFQFPNDAGTYNVIDWKTGEKTSISDKAPYYFR